MKNTPVPTRLLNEGKEKSNLWLSSWGKILFFAFVLMALLMACERTDPITVNAENLTVSMNENPIEDQLIGTVNATTNQGYLNYYLYSESLEGALFVHPLSGEITVRNPLLFDCETNPVIYAFVEVINCKVTDYAFITINLKDVDEGLPCPPLDEDNH